MQKLLFIFTFIISITPFSHAGFYDNNPDLAPNRSWNLAFAIERMSALTVSDMSFGAEGVATVTITDLESEPRRALELNFQKYINRNFGVEFNIRSDSAEIRREWRNGWDSYQANVNAMSYSLLGLARYPIGVIDIYAGVGVTLSSVSIEQKFSGLGLEGYGNQEETIYDLGSVAECGIHLYIKNLMFGVMAKYTDTKVKTSKEYFESNTINEGGFYYGGSVGIAF